MTESTAMDEFSSKKIMTIKQLSKILACSQITAKRRLKKWKALTSINKNSKYYTLPEIPVFDQNGLWKFETVVFSKYGNLKKTIIEMIKRSDAGLSGRQLSKLLPIQKNSSMLSQLQYNPEITREKHGGVYVYFSSAEEVYHSQKQRLLEVKMEKTLSAAEVITILTALIKHHNFSSDFLADLPDVKRKKISRAAIDRFMKQHGFLKKTTD